MLTHEQAMSGADSYGAIPLSADERQRNMAAIRVIPQDVLPSGTARLALVWLAETGCDMNVYAPRRQRAWIARPTPTQVWLRPVDAGWYGRIALADWPNVYGRVVAFRSNTTAITVLAGEYGQVQRDWYIAQRATALRSVATPASPGDSFPGVLVWPPRPDRLDDLEAALTLARWLAFAEAGHAALRQADALCRWAMAGGTGGNGGAA